MIYSYRIINFNLLFYIYYVLRVRRRRIVLERVDYIVSIVRVSVRRNTSLRLYRHDDNQVRVHIHRERNIYSRERLQNYIKKEINLSREKRDEDK